MRTSAWISALGLSLALGGCAVLDSQRQAPPTPVERGHALALRLCAACHAVESGGASPSPRAVAFASREMRHMAGLEGRVAALARQGHYGMPPVALSAGQADDIVAYIGSLDEGRGPERERPRALRGESGSGEAAHIATSQADEAGKIPDSTLALGRTLVVRNCGLCHAVGRSDASPRVGAPAFRDLSQRYEVEALGEALAEGILTGHPEMPEFRFAPHEVEAILRYLQSLQIRQRGLRGQSAPG